MKIALECKDLILQRALELFLKQYLTKKADCDFLVCDEKLDFNKPQFIICEYSPFLSVPFSKEELFKALSEFYQALENLSKQAAALQRKELENKIQELTQAFRKEYQQAIDEAVQSLKLQLLKILDNEKQKTNL